jgi:plasmid maintenance system killer protein
VITIFPRPPAGDDEYTRAERRAIDRGIAQSEQEYAAGKSYGPFKTAAEAIASLNANLRRRQAAKKKLKSARNNSDFLPSTFVIRLFAQKKYDEARDLWQARVNDDWRFYFKIVGDTYRLEEIKRHPK